MEQPLSSGLQQRGLILRKQVSHHGIKRQEVYLGLSGKRKRENHQVSRLLPSDTFSPKVWRIVLEVFVFLWNRQLFPTGREPKPKAEPSDFLKRCFIAYPSPNLYFSRDKEKGVGKQIQPHLWLSAWPAWRKDGAFLGSWMDSNGFHSHMWGDN